MDIGVLLGTDAHSCCGVDGGDVLLAEHPNELAQESVEAGDLLQGSESSTVERVFPSSWADLGQDVATARVEVERGGGLLL